MLFFCPQGVYLPSEDSFLLARSIKDSDAAGKTAIDVGCASGIQALNLFFLGAAKVTCLDLDEKALEAARANCEKAGFGKKAEYKKSDLFRSFTGTADTIVFNPPYIETLRSADAKEDSTKFADLDGGRHGREVLDEFLRQMPTHLKENGVCYFLQTGQNGTEQTEKLLEKAGFGFEIVGRQKLFFEELLVYRCQKPKTQ